MRLPVPPAQWLTIVCYASFILWRTKHGVGSLWCTNHSVGHTFCFANLLRRPVTETPFYFLFFLKVGI